MYTSGSPWLSRNRQNPAIMLVLSWTCPHVSCTGLELPMVTVSFGAVSVTVTYGTVSFIARFDSGRAIANYLLRVEAGRRAAEVNLGSLKRRR